MGSWRVEGTLLVKAQGDRIGASTVHGTGPKIETIDNSFPVINLTSQMRS